MQGGSGRVRKVMYVSWILKIRKEPIYIEIARFFLDLDLVLKGKIIFLCLGSKSILVSFLMFSGHFLAIIVIFDIIPEYMSRSVKSHRSGTTRQGKVNK